MKRPTVAQLQAEVEALKQRIAMLEARPAFQTVVLPGLPMQPQWVGPHITPTCPPWPPGTIIC